MSNSMYQGSALVFTHNLKNLSKLLRMAAADCKARGMTMSGKIAKMMAGKTTAKAKKKR